MLTLDERRLFDVTTRHQLYVEGVKVGMFRELKTTLAELQLELRLLLNRLSYERLDGMTRTQLNKLLVTLRKSLSKIFAPYVKTLIGQLEAFMGAAVVTTNRQWASMLGRYDRTATEDEANDFLPWFIGNGGHTPIWGLLAITPAGRRDYGRLWATAKNLPIPANGVTFPNFIGAFSSSAQGTIENVIRQAWANGLTTRELIAILVGTPGDSMSGFRQGSSSQVDRIFNQGRAVIQTVVQFIHGVGNSAVTSAYFARYMWNSVIDDRTTDICRHRNGMIYDFATGPRPPAHIRCRSHITPLPISGATYSAKSFASWLAAQPEDVQKDMAGNYRDGVYTAVPLTLAQYESKLKLILAR